MNYIEYGKNNEKYYPVLEKLFVDYKYNLKEQGIDFYKKKNQKDQSLLYLKEKDYIKYSLTFSQRKDVKISPETLGMLLESSIMLINSIGMNKVSYTILSNVANYIETIRFNKEFKTIFKNLMVSQKSKEIMLKLVFTQITVDKMKIKNEKIKQKILFSVIFCNVGEILTSEQDVNEYHATKSITILESYGFLSEDIKQGILHHHENNDGSGPLKLVKNKIHPIARIIRIVDELYDLIAKKYSNNDIIEHFKRISVKKVDSNIAKIICELLKTD